MLIGLSTLILSIGFAIWSSFTWWPVNSWINFYQPLVLFIGAFIIMVAIWWGILTLIGALVKKDGTKVSNTANFFLTDGIQFALRLIGIIPSWKNADKMPKKGSYCLVVSNHRSNLDPMIITAKFGYRKIAFLAKEKNFKYPLFPPLLKACCYQEIHRDDPIQSLAVMKKSTDYINANITSIGVFPEGTRQHDNVIGPFHEGVFNIAIRAKCPIVVMTIKDADKAGKKVPLRSFVKSEVCEVLNYSDYSDMTAKALSDKVNQIMSDNLLRA